MIPRTPPALRRRLDKLARRAHAFHRFAHHPLCAEYAGERLQFGRVRLCRGCALLALGLALGLAAGFILKPHFVVASSALSLGSLSGLLSYRIRMPKLMGRALPGALLVFAVVQGACLGGSGWVLAFLSAGVFALAVTLYRRRGPHRVPCETCPDRDRRPACRGFSPILRRERAVQRLAGRLIAKELQRN